MTKFPDPHNSHKSAASVIHPKRRPARTCGSRSCMKNPYFGWSGGKAIFCVAHKETGMVDVKNKRCDGAGCQKRRLFGFSWEKARFCSSHRLPGMVDLQNKRCKWAGCPKQASFAPEGKAIASFCEAHRSAEMIDVKNPRCESDQCTKAAGYGVWGQAPVACILHRSPHMVEMKQRRARRAATTTVSKDNRETREVDSNGRFSSDGGGRADGATLVTSRGETNCSRGGGGRGREESAALRRSRGTEAALTGGVHTTDLGSENLPFLLPRGVIRSDIGTGSNGSLGNGKPLELEDSQQRLQLLSASFASDGSSSPDSDHPGPSSPPAHYRQRQEHPHQQQQQRQRQQQPWKSPPASTPSAPRPNPTPPIFLRGSTGTTGLTFPPIFNRFGGIQCSGSYFADAGGSGDRGGGSKATDQNGLGVPETADAEAAPDAWLWDIMLEIAENDTDRSAWQQEHQQQQQLDMELLRASAGATRKLSCRQQEVQHQQPQLQPQLQQPQQWQQQQWQERYAHVSELSVGNVRRMNEVPRPRPIARFAPATAPTMPALLSVMRNGVGPPTSLSGAPASMRSRNA